MKSCSFFGHAELENTEQLKKNLFTMVENLINQDFTIFYFGGFGRFDDLCWQILKILFILSSILITGINEFISEIVK